MTQAHLTEAHGPSTGTLWVRHLLMWVGFVVVIVLKGKYEGEDARTIFAIVIVGLPVGLLFLYSIPLIVLGISAFMFKRISGLTFFRITAIMWLLIAPSVGFFPSHH